MGTPIGSTIPSIAAVPRIGTELPQTGSAARHVATLWRIARPVLANRLAGKAAICPATGREAVAAQETVQEVALATEPMRVERTASVVATSPAVGAATAMPSVAVREVRRDTTDRAHAPVAAVARQALDLGEEAVSVAAGVVGDADK